METILANEPVDSVFLRCVEDCFEPVMLTDRTGRLRYVNPAWSLTYGFSKEEAIGQTPRLLRSAQQAPDFYSRMWQTISDPQIGFWRGEVVNRAKDGHLVPVILTITPYRTKAGEVAGYMGIAVDLSEQKRMETQILRQDRLASVGLLASGLAHEIGNPLGVIRGRAELLMMQIKDNENAATNLQVIVGQIDRISALITSLLRVSRVPEKILLREVSIPEAVGEVVLLMEESCRRADIELRVSEAIGFITTEPNSFQQILLNLLINSTHAIIEQRAKGPSPILKTGERHFIDISTYNPVDGTIEIRLRDSGIGIPPENIRKLFQPFFTTKPAGQGTGMGLAIVSKLIEEMRGSIAVESEGPGRGTTILLRLTGSLNSR